MGCGPLKQLTREECLQQHFATVNVDEMCKGITNVKLDADDLKQIIQDRNLDRATVCLTCGAIFVGNPEQHAASTQHHLFYQAKTFVCTKCGHKFTSDNYNDDLKKIVDKSTKAFVEKCKNELISGAANQVNKLLGR
eukprot:TRINITY_DN6112_c0_g1_i1.p1 TRINITY_DN6112_c0_g1~~TRINITY_DN6112_c0_g1_i1.p1  ORF type:complete len:137 (-),score=29.11 TRINITY_DN6112_c0_g1_i1:180-590(-)